MIYIIKFDIMVLLLWDTVFDLVHCECETTEFELLLLFKANKNKYTQ